MRPWLPWLCAALILPLVGCDDGAEPVAATPYEWALPVGFPRPPVPADTPMSDAKVELGRRLFYDRRLSGNGTQACADCHQQALAFSDGLAVPLGSTGEAHRRNSMSLTNVAYSTSYTWASPLLLTLEQQHLVPMFGETPVELGVSGNEAEILARFAADAEYPALFKAAFPNESMNFDLVVQAIASFVRTLISADSSVDRYAYGRDLNALNASELRGMALFFSERLECHHCHGGFNFSASTAHDSTAILDRVWHNTGLYNVDFNGAYPVRDQGLHEATGDPADMGRFKAPTLRNVGVTAPYMHDGSVETLEEVVRLYEEGGQRLTMGIDAGDGRANPLKSPIINGFILSDEERADLLAFLNALTDPSFLTDPRFSDPFATP